MKRYTMIHFLGLAVLLSCCKPVHEAAVTKPAAFTPIRTVHVATGAELKAALLAAKPGDDIVLADGTYTGKFVVDASADGTEKKHITLRGSRSAILDAGSINNGYVLHLQANYWNIKGLTITNGLKGLIMDSASYCMIDSVAVNNIGEEGIHLRTFSKYNTIQNVDITNTGLKTPDFGEGIYIGSAKNNWDTYTNGNPDWSDSNQVLNSRIGPGIAAECIDVKEGTTGGFIQGNIFNATGITGTNSADSWMDVKGNNYLIEGNTGINAAGSLLKDGFQVNVAFPGWGNNNVFKSNTCTVNASGYAVLIKLSSSNGRATGNKVYATNQVTGAGSGVSNIPLSN